MQNQSISNTTDFLPLKRIDYVELYVGNAKQSAFYYQKALGFNLTGYSGLETGNKSDCSYLLEQGKIRILLTTPLTNYGFISEHIKKHGDGVRDIAFEVEDSEKSFFEATSRGARPVLTPEEIKDENGIIIKSSIATYGDTIHSFIERKNYKGFFVPGFISPGNRAVPDVKNVGLKSIDHIVGNVELGQMNSWVNFYKHIMGFSQLISFDDKDISTEYTALMSKVVQNSTGKIKFPLNEPAKGLRRSQIDEYLDFYYSAGVQHIALSTANIIESVHNLKNNGVEFLNVPSNYYDVLIDRVGKIDEDISELKNHGILIDRDEDGYLLQLFSKPIEDKPTLFLEIIQRKGAKSFGKGNFKALFESIEREQALRGTL